MLITICWPPSEGRVNYLCALTQQLRTSAFKYFTWVIISNYMFKIPKLISTPDLYAEAR